MDPTKDDEQSRPDRGPGDDAGGPARPDGDGAAPAATGAPTDPTEVIERLIPTTLAGLAAATGAAATGAADPSAAAPVSATRTHGGPGGDTATATLDRPGDGSPPADDPADRVPAGDPPPLAHAGRAPGFDRPRLLGRQLRIFAAVLAVALIYPTVTYAQALRKEGQESVQARTAQWARDLRLGFLVDWAERRHFATDQYADAVGSPDATAFAPAQTTTPPTTATSTTTTKPIPHLTPPARMASPVSPPAEGEGEWVPTGPLSQGLPGVYTTKVRPDAKHTSLTIFVAWIDPKLTEVTLFPGTNLPGGTWVTPNHIPAERCGQAILAANGGFRLEQSRGGYYAEERESHALRDGAASLVIYRDGHVDVAQWGRDVGRDQLPAIASVRQNLELLVDGGAPVPDLMKKDWGAELPNSYFVWRSAWGVTADGALIYIGGPALQPGDLAQHLVNAGAVRAMQGDINPEWVTAVLYSTAADGSCQGSLGLGGPSNTGGMYARNDRYLSTDTRDFIGVFAR